MVAGRYLTEGPDYESMWQQLEERLLEMQKAASISCCTEKDRDNISRWQGIWATFGTVWNTMQELKNESRDTQESELEAGGN